MTPVNSLSHGYIRRTSHRCQFSSLQSEQCAPDRPCETHRPPCRPSQGHFWTIYPKKGHPIGVRDGRSGWLLPAERHINSLTPGRFWWNFMNAIFNWIIDGWGISCEIDLKWLSLDLTDDKSTLVTRSCQAPSHYLSRCWPRRHMTPLGHSELNEFKMLGAQWLGYWLVHSSGN